jgi:hypothetical protein
MRSAKKLGSKSAKKLGSKSTKQTPPRFRREDWDFGDCPPKERLFCTVYELSRNNRQVVKAVKQLHKSGDWRPDPKLLMPHPLYESLIVRMFELFVEFPSTPYLCIDAHVRKERCKELHRLRQQCTIQHSDL